MVKCYNCGTLVSRKDGTETKEHIPAQNLFAGLGEQYKKNRIVVPACRRCNGDTTKIDEEFRNLIGAVSNFPELQAISNNTIKAIMNGGQLEKLELDQSGTIRGIKVKKQLIIDNHKKIFKGLFYHQYGYPIPKEYTVLAAFEPTDFSGSCINYLASNFKWKYSGHPDVFDYILQPFREGISNPEKKDLVPSKNEMYYMCLLRYNKSHAGLGIATNQPIKKRA